MNQNKLPPFTVANCVVMKWTNPIFARMGIYKKESEFYYQQFIPFAKKENISIIRADYRWYDTKTGLFTKAWYLDPLMGWIRVSDIKADIIHDLSVNKPKLMPFKKFFAKKKMFAANPFDLEMLLVDKYKNYLKFKALYPKTILINSNEELKAKINLINSEKVVIKPREGSSAKNVEILLKKDALKLDIKPNYLLQEFITTKHPVQDYRVVYANGEVLHYYTRVATNGSLFSNFSRGAKMMILKKSEVPQAVLKAWILVEKVINKYPYSMLTADFMLDPNGRAYMIEMNSKPGKVLYRPNGEMKAFEQIMKATIKNYKLVYTEKLKYTAKKKTKLVN